MTTVFPQEQRTDVVHRLTSNLQAVSFFQDKTVCDVEAAVKALESRAYDTAVSDTSESEDNENTSRLNLLRQYSATILELVLSLLQVSTQASGAESRAPSLLPTSSTAVRAPGAVPSVAPRSAESTEVWDRAVRVGWLVEWTTKHACSGLPTWQVVQELVKPHTAMWKCRYTDLSDMHHTGSVGPTRLFVSHAWGALWGDLVAAVAQHVSEDVFVWIDVFAIVQWSGGAQTQDLGQLQAVVAHSNGLICVLACDPAFQATIVAAHKSKRDLPTEQARMVPFQLIWCLEEIHTAIQCNKAVSVVAGWAIGEGSGPRTFEHAKADVFSAMYFSLDVAQAKAAFESDREMILSKVHTGVGVPAVNAAIRGALKGTHFASGHAAVMSAVVDGSLERLQQLSFDMNRPCGLGFTPLQAAAALGDIGVVQELLRHKVGTAGALHAAAEAGRVDVVRVLAPMVDVNAQFELYAYKGAGMTTPLHCAAEGDHAGALEALLEAGADVNLRKHANGRTPLRVAVGNGNVGAARRLLAAGADPHSVDARGETVLMSAASKGDAETVDRLLEAGAAVNAKDKQGFTALRYAAISGRLDVARRLLEAKADPYVVARDGETILMSAARGGNEELVELMLEAGIAVNPTDREGVPALRYAVTNRRVGAARVLLEAEADPNVVPDDGITVLMAATLRGELELVGLLMEAGAVINDIDGHGCTALRYAAIHGRLDVARRLMEAKADPHVVARDGETILMAAACSDAELVGLILEAGVAVNTADRRGLTALHYAARNGKGSVARRLVEAAADPHAEANDGMTVLVAAVCGGDPEVVELILEAGVVINAKQARMALRYAASSPYATALYRKNSRTLGDLLHKRVTI